LSGVEDRGRGRSLIVTRPGDEVLVRFGGKGRGLKKRRAKRRERARQRAALIKGKAAFPSYRH
jgi:hypothetical protein